MENRHCHNCKIKVAWMDKKGFHALKRLHTPMLKNYLCKKCARMLNEIR
jgi:uncharacterized protein YlaI